jgi:hypothetical protein
MAFLDRSITVKYPKSQYVITALGMPIIIIGVVAYIVYGFLTAGWRCAEAVLEEATKDW